MSELGYLLRALLAKPDVELNNAQVRAEGEAMRAQSKYNQWRRKTRRIPVDYNRVRSIVSGERTSPLLNHPVNYNDPADVWRAHKNMMDYVRIVGAEANPNEKAYQNKEIAPRDKATMGAPIKPKKPESHNIPTIQTKTASEKQNMITYKQAYMQKKAVLSWNPLNWAKSEDDIRREEAAKTLAGFNDRMEKIDPGFNARQQALRDRDAAISKAVNARVDAAVAGKPMPDTNTMLGTTPAGNRDAQLMEAAFASQELNPGTTTPTNAQLAESYQRGMGKADTMIAAATGKPTSGRPATNQPAAVAGTPAAKQPVAAAGAPAAKPAGQTSAAPPPTAGSATVPRPPVAQRRTPSQARQQPADTMNTVTPSRGNAWPVDANGNRLQGYKDQNGVFHEINSGMVSAPAAKPPSMAPRPQSSAPAKPASKPAGSNMSGQTAFNQRAAGNRTKGNDSALRTADAAVRRRDQQKVTGTPTRQRRVR